MIRILSGAHAEAINTSTSLSGLVTSCAEDWRWKPIAADDTISILDHDRRAAAIFRRGFRSAAADAATDLRRCADRPCVPVAGLPLPPGQPAPDRYLWHIS